MPIGAKQVRTQPQIMDKMRRIGAVAPNIINFIKEVPLQADIVKEKVKILDETDATPLSEFTNADDIVKDANTIEEFPNAVQLFAVNVRISDKALKVQPDVKENVVKKEVDDALKELRFKLGKAILSDNTPSTTDPMRMGGVGYFVGSNTNKSIDVPAGDNLTAHANDIEEALNTINEYIASKRESGGDLFAMSPALKRAFNRFGANVQRFIDVSKNELNDVITVYVGDFGSVYGYYDPALAGKEVGYVMRKEDVELGYLQRFKMDKLGRKGTYVEYLIHGYYTLLTNKYSVGKITINRT